MPFTNPITGGQGALVRPSIHSPNYVAGSMGWTINADGSAEFASLVITGGDLKFYDNSHNLIVSLDKTGLKAFGTGVNAGSQVSIEPTNATLGLALVLIPPNQSGVTWLPGGVDAFQDGTSQHRPITQITSPNISGRTYPVINMFGQGVTDNRTYIDFSADVNTFYNDNTGTQAALNLLINGTPAGNRAISFRKETDANDSFFIDYNGQQQWGAGGSSSLDVLITRSSAGALTMFGDLNATQPGSAAGTEETWHSPSYANNWSAGGGTQLKYRKLCSPAKAIQIIGSFHAPNPFVAATVFTLPSGWRPGGTQYLVATRDTAVVGQFKVTSAGVCSLENNTTPGVDWWVSGILQSDI